MELLHLPFLLSKHSSSVKRGRQVATLSKIITERDRQGPIYASRLRCGLGSLHLRSVHCIEPGRGSVKCFKFVIFLFLSLLSISSLGYVGYSVGQMVRGSLCFGDSEIGSAIFLQAPSLPQYLSSVLLSNYSCRCTIFEIQASPRWLLQQQLPFDSDDLLPQPLGKYSLSWTASTHGKIRKISLITLSH